jgi:hypothetical protein
MSKILTSNQRIAAFEALGHIMAKPDEQLSALINSAHHYNAWFTPQSAAMAVSAIAGMLNKSDLEKWLQNESGNAKLKMRSIGLILAGNIPIVGFHDILCVLASGHKALIKLSSHDQKFIPYLLNKLIEIEPGFELQISYIDRLKDFDAVIATGSNNTSRYFDYYFSKVPHIIRKNRNSVAILNGEESKEDLKALGHDIFDYFGLGCRNVSKLYVPKDYDFKEFFESIEEFKSVADHHKYNNNYDYNKSIFLVNLDKHLDTGFLLLKEDSRFVSPLAVLYYEEYQNIEQLESELIKNEDLIQCIVSNSKLPLSKVPFGQSQCPGLFDYADGVDTMKFLRELK